MRQPAIRTEQLGRIYKLKPSRKEKREARREGKKDALPKALVALDEELRRVRARARQPDEQRLFESLLPTVALTIEEVQRQIEKWNLPPHG